MSRSIPPHYRISTRMIVSSGAALIATVILVLSFHTNRTDSPPISASSVPHFVDTSEQRHHSATKERSVVIAQQNESDLGISDEIGPLMATLMNGTFPTNGTTAIVRTDENCAPDQNGVSHCLNELESDGTHFTIQHHHMMARTPCLTPGETVAIMTVEAYKTRL